MEEQIQIWLDWLNYWMVQDVNNWHPLSWAVDNNPIVVGICVISGAIIALSFIAMLFVYVSISRKQGYAGKQHQMITVFFSIFFLTMSATFFVREITFFIPIFWIYAAVKVIAAVFASLTAYTSVKVYPYLKTLPSIKDMENLRAEKNEFERKAKLLNEHMDVWQKDVGYHIELLKGQQKALVDDLASKGVPVTPLESIDTTTVSRVEALRSLEKIKGELNSLVENMNRENPIK